MSFLRAKLSVGQEGDAPRDDAFLVLKRPDGTKVSLFISSRVSGIDGYVELFYDVIE